MIKEFLVGNLVTFVMEERINFDNFSFAQARSVEKSRSTIMIIKFF